MKKITFLLCLLATALTTVFVHAQAPPGSGWTNVFADEFGGNSVNENIWTIKNPNILGREPTFTRGQVSVSNGTLKIRNDYRVGERPLGGWLQSKQKFAAPNRPKYGYYEVRLRINGPANGKIWPTFWIWGNRNNGVVTTEFDLMEYSGSSTRWFNNAATSSHHSLDKKPIFDNNTRSSTTTPPNNASQRNAFSWHVWGMHWTPNEVSFYYDGVKYFSTTAAGARDAASENNGLNLILSSSPHTYNVPGNNTGPGGYQGNNPLGADRAAKPGDNLATLEVDWVRVWTGGTINGDTGGGNGNSVTLKGQSINKFVSSENGVGAITCNRSNALDWERFTVTAVGNGQVSIQGNNGKYISSENGQRPMTCNRNAVGAWEKFTLVAQGGGVYALRGNNGKYVSHENGNGPMNCNRNAIGSWERFELSGLNSNATSSLQAVLPNVTTEKDIVFYPNPAKPDNLHLQIQSHKQLKSATLEITDITGKLVYNQTFQNIKTGTNLRLLETASLKSGIYIASIQLYNEVRQTKLIIE